MSSSVLQIIVNGEDNASRMLSGVGDSLGRFGKQALGAGAAMTAMTAPLTLMGVKSLEAAGDFEASMNVLSVAAQSSQTSLEDLSAAALAVGADAELVGISASEAGDAMTEMYKAGLSTNQVFGDMQGYLEGTTSLSGALRAAIDLAAASELDLAGATDVVVKAMNTFGLSAEDAGTIADVLVRTADAGVASVSGLAESMVNVGPVAASMGIGMGDLTTALSLMASRGIEGAEAGTQLKSMLVNMQRDTSDVVGTWKSLGLSMYDATGTMKELPVIMAELETAMAGMTMEQRNATISTLAGTYGLNAMNILLGEGVTGWDAMSDAVDEAAGVQENAAARTMGWNAAMEQLGGVIESIQITVLTPFLQNTLTPLVQKVGEIASGIMELDPKILNLGVVFAALAIAAGPVLMVIGGLAMALGALLSPIGLVVAAVAALAVAWATNFGGIRDKLAQAAAFIQAALASIRAALTSSADGPAVWAGAFERAKAVVQAVLSALSAVVGAVLGAIQTFLAQHGAEIQRTLGEAWTQIGRIVDLAVQLIQATVVPVLQGIAQFIREHGEEIQTVLRAAWTVIKNAIQIVLTVIEGILRAALAVLKGDWEGAWEIIKDTVDRVWENIKNILEAATEAIITVIGTALITIYDWFVEKFEAIKGFLEGIDLGAIGSAMIQGLIGGIQSMAGALIDAAVGVVNSAVDAAKRLLGIRSPSTVFFNIGVNILQGLIAGIVAMTPETVTALSEALSAAAQGVVDIINALTGLNDLQLIADLPVKVQILNTMIRQLVAELKLLAEFYANPGTGLDSAKAVMDALAPIFDGVAKAVGAFTAMGGIATIATLGAGLNTFIRFLRETVPQLVQALADGAAGLTDEGMLAAVALAEVAGAIGQQIQAAIDGILAAQAFGSGAPAFGTLYDGTDALFEALRMFVAKLQTTANAMDYQAFDAAVRLAQAAGAIGQNIKAAIEGILLAQAFRMGRIADGTDALFEALRMFVAKLQTTANAMDYQAFDAAVRLAQAAGAIGQNIKAAIEGILAAVAFRLDRMADGTELFISQLALFVRQMAAAGALFEEDGLLAAQRLAEAGGRIGSNIKAAIDGLVAVAAYVRSENIQQAVSDFAADLIVVATTLSEALGAPSDDLLALYDAAAAFGQRIGTIVGVISPGMSALKALGEYVRAQNIAQSVQDFAVDIITVAMELRSALGAPSDDLLALYDAAAAFGQRIGAIVGVIQPGMSALQSLGVYVRAQNIAQSVTDFAQDVMLVATTLLEGLGSASDETLAAYDAAAALAARITAVFEHIRPALDLLRELSNYSGPSAIHTGMQTFLRHIEGVMNTLGTTLQRLGPETVADAVLFSQAVRALVENVRAAMTAASGLNNAYDGAFSVAQDWMDGLIDGLNSRLNDLTALMAYIRGLFPSSPAEHGPWRDLPQGQDVAGPWLTGLADALRQTTGVEGALAGLHGLFGGGMGVPGLTPAWAGATAGGGRPGVVNIAINGPFHIREEADIRRLAEQVGDVLAGQADVRWRLGS